MLDDGLPPLREVVEACGIAPSQALGQNFIFDLNLTRRIARAAGDLRGVDVVEVGPGPGGLTRALLAEGATVVAIERDPRCRPALTAIAERYVGRLTVIEGDALALLPACLPPRPPGKRWRIVANLPYNVATALLTGWVEAEPWPPWFDRLVLMFQREVAERIVATPAERADYGRLAVLCGWRTRAQILFDVAPSAFIPPPKVVSSVVELVPRAAPLACAAGSLARVTAAAFGQRRKMLRQSLKGITTRDGPIDVVALLSKAGLDGTARAETLSIAEFVTLARIVDTVSGVA